MHRRRSVLLAAAVAALTACRAARRDDPTPAAPRAAEDIAAAVPAARELLSAAERALSAAFAPLTWTDGDPERAAASDGSCLYATTTRRCDAYLGSDRGTPARISEVLSPVLEEHGWPALPEPTGDSGGWLSAASTRGGLTFTFRSKGQAEITVSGAVDAETCALPAPSDGG